MGVPLAAEIGAARGEVVPTGAALGAEMQGVDLRRMDDALFAAVHAAWLAHSVLLFRGQSLSDDDLVAFSQRFGALDWAPVQENGRRFVDGKPEIYIVSNVLGADGQAIGSLGAGEAVWHTDMSYLPEPPKASPSLAPRTCRQRGSGARWTKPSGGVEPDGHPSLLARMGKANRFARRSRR